MNRSEAPAAITAAAMRYGVPPALALAVARAESGVNPSVQDGAAGEVGMFQLMPATAAWLSVANPRNPEENIEGGVRFLAWLMRKYPGDMRRVLEGYNGGPGNVDRGSVSGAAKQYASNVLAMASTLDVGPVSAPVVPVDAGGSWPVGGLQLAGTSIGMEWWVGAALAGTAAFLWRAWVD